jgi:hypothetical protein
MNRPLSVEYAVAVPLKSNPSVSPLALWPFLLVAAIIAFVVWNSETSSTVDQDATSPYLQLGMAP